MNLSVGRIKTVYAGGEPLRHTVRPNSTKPNVVVCNTCGLDVAQVWKSTRSTGYRYCTRHPANETESAPTRQAALLYAGLTVMSEGHVCEVAR
jgi:hypothetical protein